MTTMRSEVYNIEPSNIYCGDCLELMPHIADKSCDAIICDLPFGTTKNHWDSLIPFEPLWEQYNRIIKDDGAIVLFSQQPFTSMLVMSNPKMFKYEWIWEKENGTGFLNANHAPLKIHENILVFGKGATSPTKKSVSHPYIHQFGGGVILDNCMGSGSTIVAAIKEKRQYIGIEKDEKYFEIAKQRIKNETSQLSLF